MARLREYIARVWGTLRRRRTDADLEAELRAHLDLDDERRGRQRSGAIGVAQAMDAMRDQRGLPWLDDFFRDIRHACRLLRASPVFTAVAILSLALGVGANSAIFSLADELMLRPLPVPDSGAVLTVSADGSEDGFSGGAVSYPNYRDIRDRSKTFSGLIAYRFSQAAFSRARDGSREMFLGSLVSDNFFTALGVQPATGRAFSPDEARVPGRDAVVVLSDDFWRGTLGGDPAVVNSTVWMNGIAFQVIGIAPPGFTGLEPPVRPAFYVPAAMAARLTPSSQNLLEDRQAPRFTIKGRLAPGATRRSAQAELETIWGPLVRQYPEANKDRRIAVRTELETRVRSDPWDAILIGMLFVLVGLVLIIACANVANLMLGRSRTRSREMAIRLALGVSRSRLLRQLLAESLLLSLLGCAAGLVLAYGGIRFLQTFPVSGQVVISPQLDRRVLLFSVIASMLSAALFGLGPARQSLKTDLVPALKTAEPGKTSRQRMVGRNILVVAQVALAMILLVATGMMLDGFRKSLVLDPGFRTDHLMMLTLNPGLVQYSPQQTRAFYRDLVERARALPNVRSATIASSVPFEPGFQQIVELVPEGYQFGPGQQSASTFANVVDERYFETMGIGVTRGRGFTESDTATARRVAIVNEEFASRYWPRQDPIGKRIKLSEQNAWLEIVGTTRTVKYTWIGEIPMPFVYLPFAQQNDTRMTLFVESASADAQSLAAPLRDVVRGLDVNQPVSNVQTYEHLYHDRSVVVPGIIVKTVGTIGLLGLTLALIGLYGLVAYSVARRTREIGIRMAVGAGRPTVLAMVLRQGLVLALAGVAVGGVASVFVARALSAALVGVGTPNPATYVIVPALLLGLTAAATYFPARRASLVDPLIALRYE